MELAILRPNAGLLAAGVLLDLLLGDPQYRWHPIRLMGHSITWLEGALRRLGLDGYAGGVLEQALRAHQFRIQAACTFIA